MFRNNTEKWRWLTRLGAVLLLGIFLLVISLPNLLDLDNYRPKVLDYLRSQLAGEVSVGKLGLTYQHGPGLRIDGVKVVDKSGSQLLSVTTIIINFDLSYLLKKRLHLARLTLVRPKVVLLLDRNLSTLTNFLQPSDSNDDDVKPGSGLADWKVDPEINGAQVEIIDGTVEFTDDSFGMSAMTTRIKHLNSFFTWHETKAQTIFELTSTVLDNGGDGSLNIEGSLSNIRFPIDPGKMILDCKIRAENINAATYFPYYQEYVPMRFIGGRVDVDANYDGSLMGLFHSKGRIILRQAELDYQQVFQQKLEFERFAVDYDFRLADSYNTIETRNCTINADGITVHGYCLLHEARRGIDGTIEARLSSAKVNPLKILPLLPWKIMPEQVKPYCSNFKDQGSLVVENAYLQGNYREISSLMEEKPPVGIIGGHLYCENLSLGATKIIPSFLIEDAELLLADNIFEIKNLNCLIEGAVTCKSGNLVLSDIYLKVHSGFSGQVNIDLQKLNPYINRIFSEAATQSPSRKKSPVTFEQGAVAGKLAFSGPLSQPGKILWDGNFKGHDISFALAEIPYNVKNGTASFKFVDDNLQIDSATLDFATLPVTLHGTFPGPGFFFERSNPGIPDFNLSARCDGFTPEHLNVLTGAEYDINGSEAGSSSLEIDLSADTETQSGFKLAGLLDLEWGDVALPFIDGTIETLSCQAEFDQAEIVFKHLVLLRGKSEISFKGGLHRKADPENYQLTGEIRSPYFAPDDFPLSSKSVSKDDVQLDFRINGVVDEFVLPVDWSDKKDDSKDLWRHFDNLNFSVNGGTDASINIDECHWHWGGEQAQVSISGKLQLIDKIQGDLKIEAEDIDFDTLFGISAESGPGLNKKVSPGQLHDNEPIKAVVLDELAETLVDDRVKSVMSWKPKLAQNDLNVKLRAQRLHCQKIILDEIECDCHVNAAGINVDRLVGQTFEGKFNVYAGWRFIDNSFMFESQLDDISLETLSDYLKNPDRGLPMSGGEGSMTLDLYWQGDSLKSWEESLDGELDFNFYKGSLKRFTLIANISSILNLSQFASLQLPELSVDKGVPYDELIYKGLIIGGQFEVDEFDMQGPAFNIFGSGNIDFINNLIDLTGGIQPLQTIDKILASIPVVGYIMTGEHKTFVVIPITVQGPFDDIKIRTQTIAGMGTKTIGMIQRFFGTPVRLLRMPGEFINKLGSGNETDAAEKKVVED